MLSEVEASLPSRETCHAEQREASLLYAQLVMPGKAKYLYFSTRFKIFHYVQNDTDANAVMLSNAKHLYLYARLVMLSKAKHLTTCVSRFLTLAPAGVDRWFTTFKMTQTRILSC